MRERRLGFEHPPPVTFGPLAEREFGAAAALLADAFWDGPLDGVVARGSERARRRAARAGMTASLSAASGRAEIRAARRGTRPIAVLIAIPPGAFPLPAPSLGRQLRTLWAQGFRTASRWRVVWETLQQHRPPGPAWHLSLLGVAPEAQGQGVGSALLSNWLESLAADPAPAWLETSQERNVGFYRRHGFEVRDRFEVFGVPVWRMDRPGRSVG